MSNSNAPLIYLSGLLSVLALNVQCNVYQPESSAAVSNPHSFQNGQASYGPVRDSNGNQHLKQTTFNDAQRQQTGTFTQRDTSQNVNSNYNPRGSYEPFLQTQHSDINNREKTNVSSVRNIQNHQGDSSQGAVRYFPASSLQSPNNYLQSSQRSEQLQDSQDSNHKISQNRNVAFTQQGHLSSDKNKYDSKPNAARINSQKVKKVPIVLITIQKGQRASTNKKDNVNTNVKNQNQDGNIYKYNHNYSTYNSEQTINYDSPVQVNNSPNQAPSSNSFQVTTARPKGISESSQNFVNNPIKNNNAVQFSVPQARVPYSQTPNWTPIDGSKIQTTNSFQGINNKQAHSNEEYKISNYNLQDSQLNFPAFKNDQQQSTSHNFYSQQLNHPQPRNSHKLFHPENRSVITNGNTNINKQQQQAPLYRFQKEYDYQQVPSPTDINSAIKDQSKFQNVTFPTIGKENSNVQPREFGRANIQENVHEINSGSFHQNHNHGIQSQNQNNNYRFSNNANNLLDNSQTYTFLPNQQSQANSNSNNNIASQIESFANSKIIPTTEFHLRSANENQNGFTTKALNMRPTHSGEYQPIINQNIQKETQIRDQTNLMERQTNKRVTHSNGYVIFPLDNKYTLHNNGPSGANYDIVLNKLSSAYDPVKNLMMRNEAQTKNSNSENSGYLHNEENQRNFQRDGKLNLHQNEDQSKNREFSSYDLIQEQQYRDRPQQDSKNFNNVNRNSANQANSESNVPKASSYPLNNFSVYGKSESNVPQNFDFQLEKDKQDSYRFAQQSFSANKESNKQNVNDFSSSEQTKNYETDYQKDINRGILDNRNVFHDTVVNDNIPRNKENIQQSSDQNARNHFSNHNSAFQESSVESPNSEKQFTVFEDLKDKSKSSSPEALLLVLVASKDSYLNDYVPEQGLESSQQKIIELLGQESNTKRLIESFYSAAVDQKREKTGHSNQDLSSKSQQK
ncbi:uncharacterized protein CDAR_415191 [Caerostris darwini]|uniref:GATA zinc finger domain-containing protein 14-like n=1 Tax=Caerostris darwini TaxID=1538125 RepID=A0AAV4TLG5_9ARAC|nr:uncharacterized protein CDAR_415191 [Caerostris darwini]